MIKMRIPGRNHLQYNYANVCNHGENTIKCFLFILRLDIISKIDYHNCKNVEIIYADKVLATPQV